MDNEKIQNTIKKLPLKLLSEQKFEKAIEDIVDYVNDCEKQKEYFENKLKEYNKDEEIEKKNKTIENLYSHSLIQLSDKELLEVKEFRKIHYEKCKNGNDFIYELIGTGLGTCIKIKCPKCKKEKDITDTENW